MKPGAGSGVFLSSIASAAIVFGTTFLGTTPARAQSADAGAAPAVLPSAGAASNELVHTSSCIEHIPPGKTRPEMKETFPERGKSGYAATLHLEIGHGAGESVLPGGFKLQLDSPEGKALRAAQFMIPSFDGPAAPRISRASATGAASTIVDLSFVPLPKQGGPHTLILPSVPIAVARASGELLTLCTAPHTIQVDDPTANLVEPAPHRNPAPLRQMEVWTAAKNVAIGALIALPLGALLAFLISRWLRREKPLPPPPPPRPAWEVALEALTLLRGKRLLEQGQTSQYFAEVSLAVREYLGRRFGFDGLECTTRELLEHLAPVRPAAELRTEIEELLRRADLVKFANLAPERAECEVAVERAEHIVRSTMQPERVEPSPSAVIDVAGEAVGGKP